MSTLRYENGMEDLFFVALSNNFFVIFSLWWKWPRLANIIWFQNGDIQLPPIYKRSLLNGSHQMVSSVYLFFFGGFVGAWATQMRKWSIPYLICVCELKKYAHVYLRTYDWMGGLSYLSAFCFWRVMFLGQMFLRTSPRRHHPECAPLAPLRLWLLSTNHRQMKNLKTVTVFFSFAHRLECICGEKKWFLSTAGQM